MRPFSRIFYGYNVPILCFGSGSRSGFCCGGSGLVELLVIEVVELVHSVEELIDIYQRADRDERADNSPEPEGVSTEAAMTTAETDVVADTVADTVEPNDRCDTQCEPREDEQNPAIVHGVLAVVLGSDGVDLRRDVGHDHNTVDTKGNQTEEEIGSKAAMSAEFFHNSDVFSWLITGGPPEAVIRFSGAKVVKKNDICK